MLSNSVRAGRVALATLCVAAVACSDGTEPATGPEASDASAVVAAGTPGTVGDLRVIHSTETTLTLRFTQVTNGEGRPASYEVRYAAPPISWDAATRATVGSCAAPITGTRIGSLINCSVRGLQKGTNYNFQVRAFRGTYGSSSAVWGAVSNVASGRSNGTAAPVVVGSVTVSPATATSAIGATTALTATVRDSNDNVLSGQAVTWSSLQPAIATVSATGVATAVAAGTATIQAAAGGRTGSATLTVTSSAPPAPAPVATVTLTPGSDTVTVGLNATFAATLRDSAGAVLTGRAVAWSSTNTAAATVSSSGVVTGNAPGTTTIRATSEGRIGSATLLVVAQPPAAVATITLSPTSASVPVGSNSQFTATVRDANGNVLTGRTVSWSSSSASIATISTTGLARGVAAGNAVITATAEGRTGQANLTVTAVTQPPPTGGSGFSNAPAGFATLTDWNWSSHNGGGWSYEGDNPHTHSYQRVVSSGYGTPSPAAVGSNVLEATYIAGARGGFGPGRTNYQFSGGRNEVFVGMWHKFEADYIASDNSNKMFFFYIGNVRAFLGYRDLSGQRRYQLSIDGFGPTPGVAIVGNPGVQIPEGEWYKVEWHVRRNDAGTSNGFMRVWVNGVLTINVQNLSFPGSMSMFYVEGVHNGLNNSSGDRVIPEEMKWWLGRTMISAPTP